MRTTSRTVLIPLADFSNASGRVARVEAVDGDWAPRTDELDPRIALLRDWDLYTPGAIALGAVARLPLNRSRSVLAQRLWPGAPPTTLTVSNGAETRGLAEINGQSAELGLALAWLMHASQSRTRVAIATGGLARDTGPHNAHSDDVAVLPVGGLVQKIDALRQTLREQRGGDFGRDVLFFVPTKIKDGRDTLVVHAAEFQALKDDFRGEGVGIEVRPVGTLGQAARALGITRLVTTPAERWLNAGIVALVVALLLGIATYTWLGARLPLMFNDIAVADGSTVVSPARAIYDRSSGQFRLQKVCLGTGRLPVFAPGDSVVLRAGAQSGVPPGGIYFAVVGISERSGLKVFPSETFAGPTTVGAGESAPSRPATGPGEIALVIPVSGPEERNKLIVLARRAFPIDTADLRRRLEEVLTGKPEAERINSVVAYLAHRYPGYLDYSFLSAKEDVTCEPQ